MLFFDRKEHEEGTKVTANLYHCIKSAVNRHCLPQNMISMGIGITLCEPLCFCSLAAEKLRSGKVFQLKFFSDFMHACQTRWHGKVPNWKFCKDRRITKFPFGTFGKSYLRCRLRAWHRAWEKMQGQYLFFSCLRSLCLWTDRGWTSMPLFCFAWEWTSA